MEYWLSVGCCSVLSTRSSVRVVDVMDVDVADVEVALVVVSVDVVDVVDVADVEVALVVVSVDVVVVVVCTKNFRKVWTLQQSPIKNHPGVQFGNSVWPKIGNRI